MLERHKNLIFHLYILGKDTKSIDLVCYKRMFEHENDYFISSFSNKISPKEKPLDTCLDHNQKEVEILLNVREQHFKHLEKLPNSPKVKRTIAVIENILYHFSEWFIDNEFQPPIWKIRENKAPSFEYLPDYSIVWLDKEQLRLTRNQAKVIKVLHEAYKNNRPYLNFSHIAEEAGINADKMSGVFPRDKETMHKLIFLDNGKNQYKLNI